MTGGIFGALKPESAEANAHAVRYYGLVRKMTTDCKRIAINTGFRVKDIQRIKNHEFLESVLMEEGFISYIAHDMAQNVYNYAKAIKE